MPVTSSAISYLLKFGLKLDHLKCFFSLSGQDLEHLSSFWTNHFNSNPSFFSDTVAFFAALTSSSAIPEDTNVLFNNVVVNTGDGYVLQETAEILFWFCLFSSAAETILLFYLLGLFVWCLLLFWAKFFNFVQITCYLPPHGIKMYCSHFIREECGFFSWVPSYLRGECLDRLTLLTEQKCSAFCPIIVLCSRYDPSTGFFKAQSDGLYYFSTYLLINAGEYAQFFIEVTGQTGQVLCRAEGDSDSSGNDWSQATCSGLVQLTEGKNVTLLPDMELELPHFDKGYHQKSLLFHVI